MKRLLAYLFIVLGLGIFLNFNANSEIKKDLEGLMLALKKAGEMGLTVDVDSTAKTHGFKDFKSAVKFYEKKFKVKVKVQDAKKAFIGIDRSIDIKFTQENSNLIYEMIINSKYKGSKRYKKGYLKVKGWPVSYRYKAFAISMNIEREFAEVTKNPNMKKITPFEWSWGWDASEYGAKNNALYNCEQGVVKYKVAFQECIVVDINEKNVLFKNLPKKFTETNIKETENKNLAKTNVDKAELSQTQKVAKEKSENLYVERILTKQEKLDFEKGKIKLYKCSTSAGTYIQKDDCIGDYYKKKLLPKGLWNAYLLRDYTKTQIVKIEPTVEPKKKVKVAKVEDNTQEEFKPKKTNQDNEAPVIEIAEAITVNNPDYEIDGKVSDKADMIFVEVDGKTSEVKDGKFKIKRYSPVDHQVKIVAIDQWGNRSDEKIVNIKIDFNNKNTVKIEPLNPLNKKSETNKNAVALIIGIEKYEKAPDAKYANIDAKYFAEYAKNIFGIEDNNIKILVDENANLSNTNSAIFKWLPGKIKENKTELTIFYSGHGLSSQDGKKRYILPSNADPDLLSKTALLRKELFDQIISLNPKTVNIFFDTCYSGVSRDEETLLASARPIRVVAEDNEGEIPKNFNIFTASKSDQISSGLENAKHGIFSYYLMKGFEGNADENQDNSITNGELLTYLNKNVPEEALNLGRKQNPSFAGDPDKVLMSFR